MEEEIGKDRCDMVGVDLIEYLSHAGIFRDGRDVEETLEIARLFNLLHTFLELQKRGVLEEHHGKTGHRHVVKAMTGLSLFAWITDRIKACRDRFPQAGEGEMLQDTHGNKKVPCLFVKV